MNEVQGRERTGIKHGSFQSRASAPNGPNDIVLQTGGICSDPTEFRVFFTTDVNRTRTGAVQMEPPQAFDLNCSPGFPPSCHFIR